MEGEGLFLLLAALVFPLELDRAEEGLIRHLELLRGFVQHRETESGHVEDVAFGP